MSITKLHSPLTKISLALFTAASSLVLSSCQDEDFGYSADQIAYQTNFQKAYGKISEIPTWDLSSYNLKKLGLVGGPSNDFAAVGGAQTRAFTGNANDIVSDYNGKWYSVQERSTRWMNKNLAEKVDNRSQGKAFTLINPYYDEDNTHQEDRDFLIIPIYQGASGMCWDLHLVDDQYDYTIWSKSKDFKYTVHHNDWEEFFYKVQFNGNENKVYDHNGNKNYSAIPFNGVFDKYIDLSGAQVFFELNAGTIKGRFVIQQKVDEKNWRIAYVTDELTLSASDTRDSKAIPLNITEGQTIKSSDNTSDITVASKFSNLYFAVTEQSGGVTIDPYPAQRLHIYVKTNDTTSDTRYLYNFTSDNTHVSDGNFSGGYPAYDSRTEVSSESYFAGHTINRSDVQSKVMQINTKKLGREFTLYLETKYSDQYNTCYAKYGDKHRSNGDPNMMVALHAFNRDGVADSEKPIDIRKTLEDLGIISEGDPIDDYEYMVVGCEDAASQSDNDYNDVVLLFVGMPKVPKIATEVIQKRYMIEDLGSTFDFDFNDIVVDVTQEKIVNLKTGVETEKQIVSVAHLCGTIPFDLHFKNQGSNTTTAIFDHKFAGKNDNANNTASAGAPGYDPRSASDYMTRYVKTYTSNFPWRPEENNLVVYVWPNLAGLTDNMGAGNSSLYGENGANNLLDIKAAQQIKFPKPGEFPYIIAVDQDINWTPELYQVPKSWFETSENQNQYEQGGSTIPGVKPNKPADIEQSVFESAWNGTTIIPAANFANATNGSGVTTLDLGAFVNDNNHKYRAGDITVKVGLSANCAYDKTSVLPEVKILLVNKETSHAFADGSVSLNNFVANKSNSNIIEQSFVINNEEILAAAKSNNLTLQVTYATYGFTSDWSPRARMSLSWPNNVPYGTVTKKNGTYDSENTNSYGEKVTINDNNYKEEYSGRSIYFGGTYRTTGDTPLTAEQNAYVTIVVPAKTTFKGSIWGYDGASVYSTAIDDLKNTSESAQIFTIQLSDVLKEQLLSSGKGNLRLRVESPNSLEDLKNIDVYVNWDNNLPKRKLTIVNGDTEFDQLGLTIKVNNTSESYVAGGIDVSPNATVSVAGYWDTSKGDEYKYPQNWFTSDDYQIMWTSAKVSNISDTKHNEAFEFKMPNENVTITADFLYKLVPVMQKYTLADVATATSLDSDNSYEKDGSKIVEYPLAKGTAGDITLEWEGRKAINEPIFVKHNATVKATIAVNDGYVFKGWRWSNANTSTTYTVTKNNRAIDYAPHAAIYEGYRVTVAAIPAAAGTVKIGESAAASTVVGGYAANTNLTLTASEPNTGYAFVKWSSGHLTLSRPLDVTKNSDPVALYQKGTQIIDLSSSPLEVASGSAWDQFRYNDSSKGAANYTALCNALNSANNKLHIYCKEQTGNIKLFTFGGNDNGWGWKDLTDGISFVNGEITVTLTEAQIEQIKTTTNKGLIIQNTSGKTLNFYKIIVE